MIVVKRVILLMAILVVFAGIATGQDIYQVIQKGDVQLVQELIEEKPDIINTKDKYGLTPLHRAALYGKKDIVAMLLEKGADINTLSGFFWTPLLYARLMGHHDVISFKFPDANPIFSPDERPCTFIQVALTRISRGAGMAIFGQSRRLMINGLNQYPFP